MGTEKTIIKDSKGSGGIVGITNQKSALVRWTLTRYFLVSISGAMNDSAGIRMLSIVTSSLLLAKTRARLKTISGLI
jgi:hypothetical protein